MSGNIMVQKLWVILEFANAGTMRTEIARFATRRMSNDGISYFAKQMRSACQYLHARKITHCNITDENVLLRYKRDGSKKHMLSNFSSAVVGGVLCNIV